MDPLFVNKLAGNAPVDDGSIFATMMSSALLGSIQM
jgi:hypothetical protein